MFRAAIVLSAFLVTALSNDLWSQEKVVEQDYDVMAQFPGGYDSLMSYMVSHVNYPADAKEAGVEGKVYVEFTVSDAGKVEDARVLRGVHKSLDDEALRVVSAMPDWAPAQKGGEKVACKMRLPISFLP